MKPSVRSLCVILAALLGVAALVQFAGLFSFPGVPTAALFGGCVVCAVVVFVMGDYAQKPAFRVRRTEGDTPDAGNTVNRPAGPGPDWTYTERSK